MNKPKILFLCTGNSCRSQMAEGLARFYKGNEIEFYSAGTQPKKIDPLAVLAMQEVGIDISKHRSKHISEYQSIRFDYVVTVCGNAQENCPVLPGSTMYHRGFDDPPKLAETCTTNEEKMIHYRYVREKIREFVLQLPDILKK